MKYCNNCLQPDTRPDSVFSANGVCQACLYHKSLQKVDWKYRHEILEKIVHDHCQNGKNKRTFDCLIGVSGGKDSTRQALFVRDKLKLKPLLVCVSYPPQQISNIGVDNISNLIELGFDVLLSQPAPGVWKSLMKWGFLKFSNFGKSTELALFSTVPQIAIKYKIPLIFWGENASLQIGGDKEALSENGYDGNKVRNLNTLKSGHDWMLKAGLPENKILPYIYPDAKTFRQNNIQIIYLGWFLGDWSLKKNGDYSCVEGLKIRPEYPNNNGELYGISALDEDWVSLNQMLKYFKYGFGKATDFVNEEIRAGQLNRKDGIKLIQRYDGKCSEKNVRDFCKFIGISEKRFWTHVKNSTNWKLFYINNSGQTVPRFKVGVGL